MYGYWYGLNKYDIFLRIEKDNIALTIPVYDIYDKNCFIFNITTETCFFQYFEYCCYLLTLDESYLEFQIYNKLTKESNNTLFKRINQVDYIQASTIIDRRILLNEPYQNKNTKCIDFTYDYGDKQYQLLKKLVQMNLWIDSTNEINSVLSILRWIHGHLFHNGRLVIPRKRNAKQLLELAAKNKNTLNCRGIAIVAQELCMAASIKSRFIECSQKEKNADNCHYVIAVYIQKFKKWIFFDPTYNVIFFDENKTILSIQEVRDKLAKKQYLKLYNKAAYNRGPVSYEFYIKELIVKMYRFVSPIHIYSGCDIPGNFISLIPKCSIYNKEEFETDVPKEFWKY